MIKLDISTAIFFYLFFTVICIFALWIWLDKKTGFKRFEPERKNIQQCPICSYVYIDPKEGEFSRCPRCNSINKKEVRT